MFKMDFQYFYNSDLIKSFNFIYFRHLDKSNKLSAKKQKEYFYKHLLVSAHHRLPFSHIKTHIITKN